MAIGIGSFNPVRNGLPLLAKIFEDLRLRVVYSLSRLFTPGRLLDLPSHLPLQQRLQSRRSSALEAHSRFMWKKDPIRPAKSMTSSIEDSRVVALTDEEATRQFDELELDDILERLCIDRESFGFSHLHRLVMQNGDVILAAQIACAFLHDGTAGLDLDEIGRQLGQLGLVAVSVCNSTNKDCFYIGNRASMEESVLKKRISLAHDLTGIVRVMSLQVHQAETEIELWQKDTFICRMSVQYDIFSSWQEVLPNLENNL
eukprot:g5053.t1